MQNFKPLRLSNPAQNDLQQIADYSLQEFGELQKKRYLALIKKSFNILSYMGNIGKKRDELGLYSFGIKKYIVYFKETEQEYIVLRILHAKMDPKTHLS